MRALLANIQALDGPKDGQNSSFTRLLLCSTTPLRVQSVIELSKNLTNALTCSRLQKDGQNYKNEVVRRRFSTNARLDGRTRL